MTDGRGAVVVRQLSNRLGSAALQELDEQARNRRFRLLFRLPANEVLLEKHDGVYQYGCRVTGPDAMAAADLRGTQARLGCALGCAVCPGCLLSRRR